MTLQDIAKPSYQTISATAAAGYPPRTVLSLWPSQGWLVRIITIDLEQLDPAYWFFDYATAISVPLEAYEGLMVGKIHPQEPQYVRGPFAKETWEERQMTDPEFLHGIVLAHGIGLGFRGIVKEGQQSTLTVEYDVMRAQQ